MTIHELLLGWQPYMSMQCVSVVVDLLSIPLDIIDTQDQKLCRSKQKFNYYNKHVRVVLTYTLYQVMNVTSDIRQTTLHMKVFSICFDNLVNGYTFDCPFPLLMAKHSFASPSAHPFHLFTSCFSDRVARYFPF